MLLEKEQAIYYLEKKVEWSFAPTPVFAKLIQGMKFWENINYIPLLIQYLIFESNILLPTTSPSLSLGFPLRNHLEVIFPLTQLAGLFMAMSGEGCVDRKGQRVKIGDGMCYHWTWRLWRCRDLNWAPDGTGAGMPCMQSSTFFSFFQNFP